MGAAELRFWLSVFLRVQSSSGPGLQSVSRPDGGWRICSQEGACSWLLAGGPQFLTCGLIQWDCLRVLRTRHPASSKSAIRERERAREKERERASK